MGNEADSVFTSIKLTGYKNPFRHAKIPMRWYIIIIILLSSPTFEPSIAITLLY